MMGLWAVATTATLFAMLSSTSSVNGAPTAGPVVQTTSGKVEGFIDPSYPDVAQFLGIPYGVAPVGDLRWMPPQQYSNNETIKATATPNACPQVNSTLRTIWSVDTPQFLNQAPWAEDCLSLSVWTPKSKANATEKLPVVIFIHGGALKSGSSSVPYQVPRPWIQRTNAHIVVNIQYRLGIFGFPNAAGLNSNNLGILDQRSAIEWIRDNIAAFGGDPAQMVLWGQSAGSASIDAQNFAFPNDPIVTGFIQDSGTAMIPVGGGFGLYTIDPTHSNFTFVAHGLGCSQDPQEQLSCMRALPAESIISFIANYTNSNKMPPLYFIGTPDEQIVFSNYSERYRQGLFSNLPIVIGSNAAEGELFAPFPTQDPAQTAPNQTIATQATLELLQCPAANTAGFRAEAGRKSYRYIYNGNFSDISPLFWEGAYHAAELPQIFGTRGQFRAAASAYEVQTSNAMQDLWLGFAKQPNNPEVYGWKEAESQLMLMLGAPGESAVQVINQTVVDTQCQKAGLGFPG